MRNWLYVKRKSISLFLSFLLFCNVLFLFIDAKSVNAAETVDLKLDAKSAILIEAKTGQILFENEADIPYPPASMSKMMTEYLILESIKAGKIKWEDIVTVGQAASEVIGSRIFLAKGDKHTVKELFIAMAVGSANDASVALAEFLGGSEENFAKLMNEKAREMGLSKEANFINATGLNRADMGKYQPTGIQGETILTARDVAMLALRTIQTHPDVLQISSIPAYKFRERDEKPMINYNWMLEANKDNVNFKQYVYQGLDGLKTGHTIEAGYCFTGTAKKGDMRLISVVMGTPSEPKRFLETKKIMDYGFNNFELKTVLAASSEIESLKRVKIKKGVATEVPVVTDSGIEMVVKKGETLNLKPETYTIEEAKLVAPIKKGDILGVAKVSYNGMEKQVNLVATEDVEKGSWVRLLFRAIKNFFGDIFSGIADGIKNIF